MLQAPQDSAVACGWGAGHRHRRRRIGSPVAPCCPPLQVLPPACRGCTATTATATATVTTPPARRPLPLRPSAAVCRLPSASSVGHPSAVCRSIAGEPTTAAAATTTGFTATTATIAAVTAAELAFCRAVLRRRRHHHHHREHRPPSAVRLPSAEHLSSRPLPSRPPAQ